MEGEMSIEMLKKYIAFSRSKCGPRLSDKSADKLGHKYVMMRTSAREHERDSNKRLSSLYPYHRPTVGVFSADLGGAR